MKTSALCFLIVAQFFFVTTFSSAQSQEKSLQQHQIHLVVNQDKYVPGETIFIKAYFLDRNRKGVEGKHLISIFLVDEGGVCQQTVRFNVLGGIGHNQLILPDSLSVGYYRLVGYMSPIEEKSRGYIMARTISIVKTNVIGLTEPQLARANEYDSIAASRGPVTLTLEKNIFDKKQKVKVDVVATDEAGAPVSAEFSVTVFNNNLGINRTDLSLIDGSIAGEANQYFQVKRTSFISIGENALDRLSRMTVFQKRGVVVHAETGNPVPNNTQILFYLQEAEWYHQTFTLNGGSVLLNLPQFIGTDELFYIAETARGKIIPVKVQWESQELPRFASSSATKQIDREDLYASFANNNRIVRQSYQTFSDDDTDELPTDETRSEFELIEPDDIYKPEAYVAFQNMAEMIREVIQSMFHRKDGSGEIVRITLPDPMTATHDPVYFINGRATTSTSYFLSINPSDIEYLGVVKDPKKLKPFRLLGKNGIIIVKSKPGKVVEPNEGAEKFQGLNPVSSFSKSQPSDIPDFRSTLLWEPSIVTDRNGRVSFEFFTTDDVGEMIIQIEGITGKGQPFFYRMPIVVH